MRGSGRSGDVSRASGSVLHGDSLPGGAGTPLGTPGLLPRSVGFGRARDLPLPARGGLGSPGSFQGGPRKQPRRPLAWLRLGPLAGP